MSDIREKILAIKHPLPWDGWPKNGPFLIEAFSIGLYAAADIAEAEVARLEAKIKENDEFFNRLRFVFPSGTFKTISEMPREWVPKTEYDALEERVRELEDLLMAVSKAKPTVAGPGKAIIHQACAEFERVIGGE